MIFSICSGLSAYSLIRSTASAMSSCDILSLAKIMPPLFARFGSMTRTVTPLAGVAATVLAGFTSSCSAWKSSWNSCSSISICSMSTSWSILAHSELDVTFRRVFQCNRARRRESFSFGSSSSSFFVIFLTGKLWSWSITEQSRPSRIMACLTASIGMPTRSILKYF